VKKIIVTLVTVFILGNLFGQEVIIQNEKYCHPDGSLFSGVYQEYDQQHILIAENTIHQGLLEGISNIYYPSGKKKEQRSYTQGKKDGLWINWNESGIKTAEARFKDGRKDGYWYIWDDQGSKRYEMFYRNGEKKGTWFIWDENGKLITEQNYD
jgi:antitoxin component YwqK of YwqJK toxin-antitoxin module